MVCTVPQYDLCHTGRYRATIPYDNSTGLYPCTYVHPQINDYDNTNLTSTIPIIDIDDDDNDDGPPPLIETTESGAHAC